MTPPPRAALWYRNLRTAFFQAIIDFGERRMFEAQDAGRYRASRYGDHSWQRHLAFKQELFWHHVQTWALYA